MDIKILNKPICDFDGDILIVSHFEGMKQPRGHTTILDKVLQGIITDMINHQEITGKLGETVVFHTFNKIPARRVMVLGLGEKTKFNLDTIRKAAGAAIKKALKSKAKSIGTVIYGTDLKDIDFAEASQAIIEGTILGIYKFKEYKNRPDDIEPTQFSIIESNKDRIKAIKKGTGLGKILAESQNIARDLINEPANNLTPERLFLRINDYIKKLKLSKAIEVKALRRPELKKLKMGALLSVAQGSSNEPYFISLRIKNSKKPLTALIGKTVTFDSGGISLKPAKGMETMKGDMAGGAAVLGTTLALARVGAKVNLLTILPAVENLPSRTASRPGDIVRAMNNKAIEIISTDAEGRLTLADAICYSQNKGAKYIIDIATLTGGCVVTFGDLTAAIMGNNPGLINRLLKISNSTGEKFWELPLFEEYAKQIESDVADIKNSGGRKAHTITAGIFLKEFVEDAIWLHIDIAGKEMAEEEDFYTPEGGTGFGVRSLYQLIISLN